MERGRGRRPVQAVAADEAAAAPRTAPTATGPRSAAAVTAQRSGFDSSAVRSRPPSARRRGPVARNRQAAAQAVQTTAAPSRRAQATPAAAQRPVRIRNRQRGRRPVAQQAEPVQGIFFCANKFLPMNIF